MAAVVDTLPTAEALRARRAVLMVPVYILSHRVGIHPSHLGGMLRGRIPMSPETARRIAAALDEPEAAVAR
jgi:thiamine transporter ThiT